MWLFNCHVFIGVLLLFTFFIIHIVYSIFKKWLLRKRMPPGPIPMPIIGNLLIFQNVKLSMHELFLNLSKTYGDPMTIFFANTPFVVLTKYPVIKSILSQTTFSSRQDSVVIDIFMNESVDLPFGKYGPAWKLLRTVLDVQNLEEQVLQSIDKTLDDMLTQDGSLNPMHYTVSTVYNIMSSLVFGKSYEINDPEFVRFISLNELRTKEFSKLLLLDFLPCIQYLPLQWLPAMRHHKVILDDIRNIYLRFLHEHRASYAKDQIRDFCDELLHAQESLRNESSEEIEFLNDDQISWLIMDFFNAGSETTIAVLNWFCLFMITHPEIQEECHEVIRQEIGDRRPELRDRFRLPFVEACILETMRLRPVLPSAPHSTTCDTQIGDYFIPKGAVVLGNIYAIQNDPDYWDNPSAFDPRLHFLDEYGHLKKPTSFAPFGFGKRSCLGDQLAKNDLFLIVIRLLQRLRLEPIENMHYNLNYNHEITLIFNPLPFSIRVSPRKAYCS